ncbi:MAG: hypothetical protein AB7O80_10665 [Acetobacteraceae bacterium]
MTNAFPPSGPCGPGRRAVLAALAGLPFARQAGAMPSAITLPQSSSTLLIGGPDGGILDNWGRIMEPPLAQGLREPAIKRASVGGIDGVTAANQFTARGEPDGQTALMTPGEAILAWAIGDPRAKYDVGRWTAVMSCMTPGAVIFRPGTVASRKPVRVASAGFATADLTALLGLELLGSVAVPVPVARPADLLPVFAQRAVDAVLVRGHNVGDQARPFIQAGGEPLFSLGRHDGSGRMARCEFFSEVPTLAEAYATMAGPMPPSPLAEAWVTCAVASQLEFMMVLPHLTPAAQVALWRQASVETVASQDMQTMAQAFGVRPVAGADAAARTRGAAAHQNALTALRQWLAGRFNWRPT